MGFVCRHFRELGINELFSIYRLRSEVFVVEQNCAYQDVDEKDRSSFHVMLFQGDDLIAYSRLIPPGLSYSEMSIGRVVVPKRLRGSGTGKRLMDFSVQKCYELFEGKDIVISAQTYLRSFYSALGFKPEGEEYLEDDIPHIKMRFTRG